VSGLERRIARRYARAIVALIAEGKPLRDALLQVADAVSEPKVQRLLASPVIAPEAKLGAIEKALPELPQPIKALLRLLARRNKLVLLPLIAEEVEAMLAAQSGKVDVEVISAVELDSERRKRLQQAIERATGKKAELSLRVDASILGGLIVRIGDRVIDASLRAQLDAMRRAILAAA